MCRCCNSLIHAMIAIEAKSKYAWSQCRGFPARVCQLIVWRPNWLRVLLRRIREGASIETLIMTSSQHASAVYIS